MEEINVKDYKGNYRKLRVTDTKIFLDKINFDYSLKNLVALIALHGLLLPRPYNRRKKCKS